MKIKMQWKMASLTPITLTNLGSRILQNAQRTSSQKYNSRWMLNRNMPKWITGFAASSLSATKL